MLLAIVVGSLVPASAAVAAPNGDEITSSVESGQVGAAVVVAMFSAGIAGVGVVILQRFLHAAVRAS